MQITIMAVGKQLPPELHTSALEYEKRLQQHATINWKLLAPSQSKSVAKARAQESADILSRLQVNDSVILLDERGTQQNNEDFAKTFEKLSGVQGKIVVVIGGAFGVTDEVRDKASFVWSFSKLVFPHQLIRLMLLEQLYRTFMVQIGHPYHHN